MWAATERPGSDRWGQWRHLPRCDSLPGCGGVWFRPDSGHQGHEGSSRARGDTARARGRCEAHGRRSCKGSCRSTPAAGARGPACARGHRASVPVGGGRGRRGPAQLDRDPEVRRQLPDRDQPRALGRAHRGAHDDAQRPPRARAPRPDGPLDLAGLAALGADGGGVELGAGRRGRAARAAIAGATAGVRAPARPRLHGRGDRRAHGHARRHREGSAGERPQAAARVHRTRGAPLLAPRRCSMSGAFRRWSELRTREALGEALSVDERQELATLGAAEPLAQRELALLGELEARVDGGPPPARLIDAALAGRDSRPHLRVVPPGAQAPVAPSRPRRAWWAWAAAGGALGLAAAAAVWWRAPAVTPPDAAPAVAAPEAPARAELVLASG